jgi:hypothetical protein
VKGNGNRGKRAVTEKKKPAFGKAGNGVHGRNRPRSQGKRAMARIIVTTDPVGQRDGPAPLDKTPVLLDERVNSAHLGDDHAAKQLIERLAWAVTDAEDVERVL